MIAEAGAAPISEQLPSVVEAVNTATESHGIAPIETERIHKTQCIEAEMSGFDATAFTELGHCLTGIVGAVSDNSEFNFEGLVGDTADAMRAAISAAGKGCINHAESAENSGRSVNDCGAAVEEIVATAEATANGIFSVLQQPLQMALALCPLSVVGPSAAHAAKAMCEVLISCLDGVFEARNTAVTQCYEQVCHDVEQIPEACEQTANGKANLQPASFPSDAPSAPSIPAVPLTPSIPLEPSVPSMPTASVTAMPAADQTQGESCPDSPPERLAEGTQCQHGEALMQPAAASIQSSVNAEAQIVGTAGTWSGQGIGAAVGELIGGAIGGAIEGTATALLNFDLPDCSENVGCQSVCETIHPECECAVPQTGADAAVSPPCVEELPKQTDTQTESSGGGAAAPEPEPPVKQEADLASVPEPAPPAEKLEHLDSSTYSLPAETPPTEQDIEVPESGGEPGENNPAAEAAAPTEAEDAPGPTQNDQSAMSTEELAATVHIPSAGEW